MEQEPNTKIAIRPYGISPIAQLRLLLGAAASTVTKSAGGFTFSRRRRPRLEPFVQRAQDQAYRYGTQGDREMARRRRQLAGRAAR